MFTPGKASKNLLTLPITGHSLHRIPTVYGFLTYITYERTGLYELHRYYLVCIYSDRPDRAEIPSEPEFKGVLLTFYVMIGQQTE